MKRVLVVEDDKAVMRGLVDTLKREHYEVSSAENGARAYELAKSNKFDLILLDVLLPEMDGFEVCRKLRADGIQTTILMLTSKKEEVDKVLGLEIGADDYVTKPFSLRELMARIKARLRRDASQVSPLQEIEFDEFAFDFKKQEGRRGSRIVKMSAKEFELLKYFAEREGDVITRAQLLDDVWGYEALPTTRTVDNYVLSLRKKIEENPSKPKHLLTVHTKGYKFVKGVRGREKAKKR